MKNILKGIILPLLPAMVFALHGKIVFYDGTYVVGKVTKVDEAVVYIVPIGLDTSEGVLVGNIDSLKLENGMRKLGCRLYLRSKVQLEPEKWFQQLAGQSILSYMNSHHMRIDVKILLVNLTHLAKKPLVKQFMRLVHQV